MVITRRTMLGVVPLAGAAALAAGPTATPDPDQLFASGRFTEADALYRLILARDPDNVHALAMRGHLAQLANRLAEAETLLMRALRLDPEHQPAWRTLANTLYRHDRFPELASVLPRVRAGGPATTAALMRAFAGLRPYQITGPHVSTIRFLSVTPLPLIEVSVNGAEPVVFFLDTGGMFGLNEDYAARLRIPLFGSTTGGSIDGPITIHHARVDQLTLGDMTVRHLPAHTMPSDGPASGIQAPDGRFAQGVIGTSVLAHFLPTIDYVRGQLVLRRRGTGTPPGAASTPLWFHGDHFMLAHGTVNETGPLLFFIDTGGAHTGVTAPDSTFTAAGITIPPGDGPHPVVVGELRIGPTGRRDVPGTAGTFPESLVDGFGFGIGGLITHRFFTSFALTFDFDRMRVLLHENR